MINQTTANENVRNLFIHLRGKYAINVCLPMAYACIPAKYLTICQYPTPFFIFKISFKLRESDCIRVKWKHKMWK